MSRERRMLKLKSADSLGLNSSNHSEASAGRWSLLLRLLVVGSFTFAGAYLLTKTFNSNVSQLPVQGKKSTSETVQKPIQDSMQLQAGEGNRNPSTAEMVWIPPTEFVMGSTGVGALPNEQPAHSVIVDGFWIDEHEVTNSEFRKFVDATGYVTTAEIKPDWEEIKKSVPPGTPRPPEDVLVPGSLVFVPPSTPVSTEDASQWWVWMRGACWKNPEGAGTTIVNRENHPVVHVSWFDANAYCKWSGKRLPTEAEWECAARGKLAGKRFAWGDEPPNDSSRLANIWQGVFPHYNEKLDGWERTSPVKSYPANGYGLYDMSGNVWEWCSDWYRSDAYLRRAGKDKIVNPPGPTESWDPNEPHAQKRTIRGGSFLCHITYCESYRTAARRGNTPDTGMSHLGFRCVLSEKQNP